MLVARLHPSPSSPSSPPSPPSSPDLLCQLLIAVGLAGPPLPALDCSGPRWTSTASSRSQWASPDLICQHLIAVSLAGPQLLARDRCGPRRTSPGEPERCGPRRTSTGESLSAVGLAGASPDLNLRDSDRRRDSARQWASPELNWTSTARNNAR